ncbi:hypothetical protein LSH36_7g06030 [Paralvinella palmiformis]|uniref:Uncharacterized protein n=1 Tax=Paralvinella palmiformis TaxID=53620 RepID=A0AAD9KFV8_9ANNE|nr:hypothetical protein LSH36_7g06030 [Paralvinella palmiformis]
MIDAISFATCPSRHNNENIGFSVFSDPKFTTINYILWVIGSGIICFFLVALLIIFIVDKKRAEAKQRRINLANQRPNTKYCHPVTVEQLIGTEQQTKTEEIVKTEQLDVLFK